MVIISSTTKILTFLDMFVVSKFTMHYKNYEDAIGNTSTTNDMFVVRKSTMDYEDYENYNKEYVSRQKYINYERFYALRFFVVWYYENVYEFWYKWQQHTGIVSIDCCRPAINRIGKLQSRDASTRVHMYAHVTMHTQYTSCDAELLLHVDTKKKNHSNYWNDVALNISHALIWHDHHHQPTRSSTLDVIYHCLTLHAATRNVVHCLASYSAGIMASSTCIDRHAFIHYQQLLISHSSGTRTTPLLEYEMPLHAMPMERRN